MKKIGLLIPHQYKLLSVAALLDVFETVNKFYRQDDQPPPFEILPVQSAPVINGSSSILFGYKPGNTQENLQYDLVLIPSFTTENIGRTMQANKEFVPWIQEQYKSGAEIATFCTGAFLLGTTGLLDGKIATTHVDACSAFAAAFPLVKLRADKTVTCDGRLYTSGGATSTFHLLLHLVQRHCGREIAVRTAKMFAIDMDRQRQSYFSTFHPSRDHHDELVATAQQKIESNYQDSGTIEEMIKDIPSSRRNIVRRFKQVTGITPIEYLQQTRIEAAKKLLEQTAQQMTEIIFKSGYNDPKSFRKVFRKTVGMTPTEYRVKFQVN